MKVSDYPAKQWFSLPHSHSVRLSWPENDHVFSADSCGP